MSVQTITRPATTSALAPVVLTDWQGIAHTTTTTKAHTTRTATAHASLSQGELRKAKWFTAFSNCPELDEECFQAGMMKPKNGYPLRVCIEENLSATGHVIVSSAMMKRCVVHFSQLTNEKIEREWFTLKGGPKNRTAKPY
jgi:hypothetical protein